MKKKRVQKGQSVISFRCPKQQKEFIAMYVKAENTDIKLLFTNYIDELMTKQKQKADLAMDDMSDIFGG